MSDHMSSGYAIALEPWTRRILLHHEYLRTSGPQPGTPLDVGPVSVRKRPPHLQRRVDMQPRRPVSCRILLEGSIVEAFFDDQVALTARVYNH